MCILEFRIFCKKKNYTNAIANSGSEIHFEVDEMTSFTLFGLLHQTLTFPLNSKLVFIAKSESEYLRFVHCN